MRSDGCGVGGGWGSGRRGCADGIALGWCVDFYRAIRFPPSWLRVFPPPAWAEVDREGGGGGAMRGRGAHAFVVVNEFSAWH